MKYNVYIHSNDKQVGVLNTDDYESDAFHDAMRKFEEDNHLIETQFDIFDAATSEWVTTIASFRAA